MARGDIVKKGTALTVSKSSVLAPSQIKFITDNLFLRTYYGSSGENIVESYSFDKSTGTITYLKTLTFEGTTKSVSSEAYMTPIPLNSTEFVIVWGNNVTGIKACYARTFKINLTTGAISTWGTQVTIDSDNGTHARGVQISSYSVAVMWTGKQLSNNREKTAVLDINSSTGAITKNTELQLFGPDARGGDVKKASDDGLVYFTGYSNSTGQEQPTVRRVDVSLGSLSIANSSGQLYAEVSQHRNIVLLSGDYDNFLAISSYWVSNKVVLIALNYIDGTGFSIGTKYEISVGDAVKQRGYPRLLKTFDDYFVLIFVDTDDKLKARTFQVDPTTLTVSPLGAVLEISNTTYTSKNYSATIDSTKKYLVVNSFYSQVSAGVYETTFQPLEILFKKSEVLTKTATGVTSNEAQINGEITSVGDDSPVTKRGFAFGLSSKPLPTSDPTSSGYDDYEEQTGSFSEGNFDETISDLAENTTYFYRAYSYTDFGYSWGNELQFTTLQTGKPFIKSISPEVITTDQAETITIEGSNFELEAEVYADGVLCDDIYVVSDEMITFTIPASSEQKSITIKVSNTPTKFATYYPFTYMKEIPPTPQSPEIEATFEVSLIPTEI